MKLEILRKLDLYKPTSFEPEDIKLVKNAYKDGKSRYYISASDDFFYDHFFHFPIIVDADGSPWKEANRYLLNRLGGFNPAKYRTLESIASDLAHFRRWLVNESIDFLNIPPRQRARPTYRYAAFLHGELQLGKGKASTAKRRISSMQNFYRWLEKDGTQFNHPLWMENDLSINFKDKYGFQHSKAIKSTDIAQTFVTSNHNDDYSEYLNDGGKLRPLPKDEQTAIVVALKQVGNIEMLLSFLLALTTGARLQTVFTFRQLHFAQEKSDKASYHRVKVGGNTLVDTKFNKQIVLHIPSWLYHRIQIYLRSERYKARVNLSKHIHKHEEEQYLFLTRTGQPYYMANNDDFAFLYRSPPKGNAVTQFIRQQLKPKLRENNHNFNFRFHDLRASFGMNLLEDKLVDYKQGDYVAAANKPEFFQILMYVKTRMGHSQIRTTEAYLNYRQKYKLALHIQSDFEQFLEELTTPSKDITYDLD